MILAACDTSGTKSAMAEQQLYERIGAGYASQRRADPRWARTIRNAIGDSESVLNVGAGTGSYEPTNLAVVALEPSITMVRQRAPGAAPAVCSRAEAIPFPDRAFDCTMATHTLHHWSDWR